MAGIVFARSGLGVGCTGPDTIMQMARGNGVALPSGCNFGLCGICKLRKLSREGQMLHNDGMLEEAIATSFILACGSRPMGGVEVDA